MILKYKIQINEKHVSETTSRAIRCVYKYSTWSSGRFINIVNMLLWKLPPVLFQQMKGEK